MAVAQLVCVCAQVCCMCMHACMHAKLLVAVVKLVRDGDSWIQGHAGGLTAFNNTVYTHMLERTSHSMTEFL